MEEFCRREEAVPERQCHPLVHLPGLPRYALAGRPLELRFEYSKELADKIRHLVCTAGHALSVAQSASAVACARA